jgi:hypothetical protein
MAHESAGKRNIEGDVQEKVLGAEHQCGHRLDLGGLGPLPEILDPDMTGWQPVCRTDVRAYVEHRHAPTAPILETGMPIWPSTGFRCRRRRGRMSHAYEERFDPGSIAFSD